MRTYSFVRYLFLSGGLFLYHYTPASAQTLSLNDETVKTEDGQEVDAWVAELDQNEEYCKETFEKFVKDNYGLKVEKRAKNILVVPKAKLVEISRLRGDFRAVFTPRSTGTKVAFAFSPGYDIHINKQDYPDELEKISLLTRKYIKFHYNTYYKEQIDAAEKKIKEKQKDIERNDSRISRNRNDIAANETKINAGDKQTPKLTDRNRKMHESIAEMESETGKLQEEIDQLRQSISQAQTSLQKVSDYQ